VREKFVISNLVEMERVCKGSDCNLLLPVPSGKMRQFCDECIRKNKKRRDAETRMGANLAKVRVIELDRSVEELESKVSKSELHIIELERRVHFMSAVSKLVVGKYWTILKAFVPESVAKRAHDWDMRDVVKITGNVDQYTCPGDLIDPLFERLSELLGGSRVQHPKILKYTENSIIQTPHLDIFNGASSSNIAFICLSERTNSALFDMSRNDLSLSLSSNTYEKAGKEILSMN